MSNTLEEQAVIDEIWDLYDSDLPEEEVLEKLESYPKHLVKQVTSGILSLLEEDDRPDPQRGT